VEICWRKRFQLSILLAIANVPQVKYEKISIKKAVDSRKNLRSRQILNLQL
jgi:hypothetical protein